MVNNGSETETSRMDIADVHKKLAGLRSGVGSASGLRGLLGGKQRVLGDPENLGARILKTVIILSAMGAVAGIWTLIIKDVNPQRSSFGAAAPVLKFATSTWSYIVLELLLLRSMLYISKARKARQAARYFGMDPEAIQRLEAEAKTTSNSTRVVATSEDSAAEITQRIREGMDAGEDDILKQDTPVERTETENRIRELEEREWGIMEELDELQDEIEGELGNALQSRLNPSEILESDAEQLSMFELMDADGQESVDAADELLEEAEQLETELQEIQEELSELRRLWFTAEQEVEEAATAAQQLEAALGAAGYQTQEEELSWSEKFKLWRMDTAAALESGDLLWQFAVPAALTTFGLVIAAGIWLRVWIYPLLASAGVLVGALNYARISRSREKRAESLRNAEDTEQWDSCSVLVKGPIEAGTTEMCYAWFNGDGYAHHSPERLSEEVGERAHQLLQGEQISPSVLQKHYRNIRDMYVDLEGWRGNIEEHQISEELISTVEEAPDGIIPKAKLMEDVVLHDKETRMWGMFESGLGFDPELVRECYEDLVPIAIVEEEMQVEGPNGDMHSVTACRLRTEPLPADLSEVRAQFSSRFRAYAEFEPLFELPEVEEEPELQHHAHGGI